jgi:hypothetical protein
MIVVFSCMGIAESGIMPPMKYWEIIAGKLSAAWLSCSMKCRLFAATLGALLVIAECASAGLITFTGVIDEVRLSGSPMPFSVGDPFSASFHFVGPPDPSGIFQRAITSFEVALGNSIITGFQDGSLFVQVNVTNTNLLYQVVHATSSDVFTPYTFSDTDILIYDPAVGGVVPPFDQLSINFFDVALLSPQFESDFASGHLTSFPIITSTPGPGVPEGGSSLVFLGFAILSVTLAGFFFVAPLSKPEATLL